MKFNKHLPRICQTMLIFLMIITKLNAQSGIEPSDLERVGLSGWQFLKLNLDPRQAAMGGAFTAISHGDVGAIYGNPSALVDVKNFEVGFYNVNYIADINYVSAALAKNVNGIGIFAISIASLDVGDIPRTLNSIIPGEDRTEAVVTGETFSGGDFAAGISYAMKITDRLAIGANVRWIREEIDDLDMNNVSFDFGTTYYTGFKSLRLAMTARNFGPDQNLAGWSEEVQIEPVDIRMPLDFRVGVAMDLFEREDSPHFLTLAIEGTHPNDGPEKINFGAEYWFHKMFSLRGGYRINYDEETFTLGGGVKYSMRKLAGKVNYAFVDFGRLEQVHIFNLGLEF
jgi:hypothetical protein